MELSMRERRELDTEIAIKIFGWSDPEIRNGNMVNAPRLAVNPRNQIPSDTTPHKSEVPKYSEDISLAWDIVNKLEKTITLRQYSYNRTYVTFGHWDNSEEMTEANGRYCTPTAICLAAMATLTQPNKPLAADPASRV